MSEQLRYSMVIEWSDEDQAYLVTLPEWADHVLTPVTHGDTYNEAVQRGQEVLAMLIGSARADGQPLPVPRSHDQSSARPRPLGRPAAAHG
jgi:predicted RNase H-like HicB family nuclease